MVRMEISDYIDDWKAIMFSKNRVVSYICLLLSLNSRIRVELKGEIRNRFNVISEGRVRMFEQNSETWWKSVEKLGSYDTLKFRKMSRNISWPLYMNMQMSELMMSSAHNFPLIFFYTEMTQI